MDIFVIILIAIYVKFKTRVMRKSLLYVFAVICTMGFFTACGDDDDSSSSGNWQDLSKTYEGKSVNLVESGCGSYLCEYSYREFYYR